MLVPFAPSAGLVNRFREMLAIVLRAHGINEAFIDQEIAEMADYRLAKTESRSLIGMMNEFSYLSDVWRQSDSTGDLVELSVRLAATPCGPLYKRNGTPAHELTTLVAAHDA